MNDYEFPIAVSTVVTSLALAFEQQEQHDLVRLIRSSHTVIEFDNFDNWDGGTNYYSLVLEVPITEFISVESKIKDVEAQILKWLNSFFKNERSHIISSVVLKAMLETPQRKAEQPYHIRESIRLWPRGCFRLFLSHTSKYKVEVKLVKEALAVYGISAFVAHMDIAPSLEWQSEIELALDSMHALAALLTDDFHSSKWTDQEVGYALGRKVPVIPIRLPVDPYGLIGKIQGASGNLSVPDRIAAAVVNVLLSKSETKSHMMEALVVGIERSGSFADSRIISSKIVSLEGFSEAQLDRVMAAANENFQVRSSFGVPDRIRSYVAKFRSHEVEDDDLPF